MWNLGLLVGKALHLPGEQARLGKMKKALSLPQKYAARCTA